MHIQAVPTLYSVSTQHYQLKCVNACHGLCGSNDGTKNVWQCRNIDT